VFGMGNEPGIYLFEPDGQVNLELVIHGLSKFLLFDFRLCAGSQPDAQQDQDGPANLCPTGLLL